MHAYISITAHSCKYCMMIDVQFSCTHACVDVNLCTSLITAIFCIHDIKCLHLYVIMQTLIPPGFDAYYSIERLHTSTHAQAQKVAHFYTIFIVLYAYIHLRIYQNKHVLYVTIYTCAFMYPRTQVTYTLTVTNTLTHTYTHVTGVVLRSSLLGDLEWCLCIRLWSFLGEDATDQALPQKDMVRIILVSICLYILVRIICVFGMRYVCTWIWTTCLFTPHFSRSLLRHSNCCITIAIGIATAQ
jgi:hypothetical protein